MHLTNFQIYLLIINGIGLVVYLIAYLFRNRMGDWKDDRAMINKLFIIVSFLGGMIGIALGWAILEHRLHKASVSYLLFVLCTLVIWCCIYFSLYGSRALTIRGNAMEFLQKKGFLMLYLLVINVVTAGMFRRDKRYAEEDQGRIPVACLLGICMIGGSVGGLYGMYKYHHKTQVFYFRLGIPMIIVTETILILFLQFAEWI